MGDQALGQPQRSGIGPYETYERFHKRQPTLADIERKLDEILRLLRAERPPKREG